MLDTGDPAAKRKLRWQRRRARRHQQPQEFGLGPRYIAVVVFLLGFLFSLLVVFSIIWFRMGQMREIWLLVNPAGLSIFACTVLVGLLLMLLTTGDVIAKWFSGKQLDLAGFVSYGMIVVVLGVLACDVYVLRSIPFNDLWYRWATVGEPDGKGRYFIGRITDEVPDACETCVQVWLETGEQILTTRPADPDTAPSDLVLVYERTKRYSGEMTFEIDDYIEVDDVEIFWTGVVSPY